MSASEDGREFRPEASERRLTSDLEFREVDPVPRYTKDVVGGVSFVPVSRAGGSGIEVLGYLWFSDAEGGAGYIPRARMVPDGFNSGVIWSLRLRAAKGAGELPSSAVLGFRDLDPDVKNGQAMVDDVTPIESLAALKELARR